MTDILSYLMIGGTLLILLGCQAKLKNMKMDEHTTLQAKAEALLGSDFNIVNNSTETFAVVSREIKARPNQVFPTLKFFVYDHAHSQVIHEAILTQGKVKWVSEFEVLCESIPGRVQEQIKSKKYLFDVRTKLTNPTDRK